MGAVRAIRAELEMMREESWGVFYMDDSQWEQFMERFRRFTRERVQWFEKTGGGEPSLQRLEWNVQEDPVLEKCSLQEIGRRHRDVIRARYGEYSGGHVRHAFPLIVTQEAMDSVLAAPAANDWRPRQQEDREQKRQEGMEAEGNISDDEENVPLRKVFVRDVYPRLYSMLIDAE
ncbi:hypothetical protein BO82DRAFT_96437 [Aspergillus uvarum CBS 121591]|uniref:Uncharacterized protein n=1 Tax=Aspergillus uvarum CBS 121591 TaxID=1448315 RepID=A0A319CQX7_9EURO|nr:hypothetical protein BO82DRAFT_96437 [Aspergillus uvarum CBS 121591]PYH81203.1 hypothetical protein BO82DRAFT_96437 [Aspergillus uvarum CBS 121591]